MLIFSCAKADALVKMHLYWDFLSWKKTLISFKVWVLYIVKFYSECVRMVKRSLYLFFEQWSHSKKRKNLLSDFISGKNYSYDQGKWKFSCSYFRPVSAICAAKILKVIRGFAPALKGYTATLPVSKRAMYF